MLEDVRQAQHGIVHRNQARLAGLSVGAIRAHLNAGRWRRVAWATYATFSGPLDRDAELWRAVLACGDGATLSHHTAAELYGLIDDRSDGIHVTLPANRRIAPPSGVVVHYAESLEVKRHPSLIPARVRVDETVLDPVDLATTADRALALVSKAVGRRLTTVQRLRTALGARRRFRWRREMAEALDDIEVGCHSLLELRYLRDVERGHGLPQGRRQAEARRHGRRIYRDVHYDAHGVVVELDGAVAHPTESLSRDRDRDNAEAVAGGLVLHYDWSSVTRQPCRVAAEVADVLRSRGWQGHARRCSRICGLPKG